MNLSSTARQIVFWLLIIAGAVLLYKLVNPRGANYESVDLTRIDQMIQARQLKQLTVKQTETVAIDNNNKEYRVALSNDPAKNDLLKAAREVVDGRARVPKVKKNRAAATSGPC